MQRIKKHKEKVIIRISISWIIAIVVILVLACSFFKNKIFATDEIDLKDEKNIAEVEKNENAVDVLKLMVENNYENKRLVNEERIIKFETKTEKNDKLPKGEKKVVQEGKDGKKKVIALKKYNENEYIEEEIIEEKIIDEPVTEMVQEGTSEFLSKYNVHIGEEMYLIESGKILEKKEKDSKEIYNINRYLNVKLEDFDEKWAKIKYKDYEGYVEIGKLTSETVTPKILEKNRIAKLKENLDIEMDLSKPSGLTLSDYKTIFNFNSADKNAIFAENAEKFYNAEQKYQINGIFLAAVGIHESAWGTSKLAKEKNNLFGYQAYDRDPINSAMSFESYEECINTVAEALHNNYLTEGGVYYNGTTVKDVNVKYASDKEWFEKVYKKMEYLYEKLG